MHDSYRFATARFPTHFFLLLILSPLPTAAVCAMVDGVDVSQPVSVANFQCLNRNHGKQFAIVRVWRSNGQIDGNAVQTMANAWAAGMESVDGYIFPCFKCANALGARQQIVQLLQHLDTDNQARYGRLWLDIEGTQFWSSNKTENIRFVQEVVDELMAQGKSIGFYTSRSQWTPIMGDNNKQFSALTLWYAHYDKKRSFEDFVPFGGWAQPAMKQWNGDVKMCGVGVDENWKP